MNYKGSCHCGRVAYKVEVEPKTALECNCSICSRKGYLLWFTPRSHLNIIKGEDSLATYTFGHHVIKHMFCPNCGCAPFGIGKPAGAETEPVAVNVRCLEDIDLDVIHRQPFDGRSL